MKKLQALHEMIEPLVAGQNLELVDIEYRKEKDNWLLRISIDKPEGISHEDCARVSRALDPLLEESDLISDSYILEVSSPGVERPLKKEEDFIRFAGKKVLIKTYQLLENQKTFRGKLLGLEEGQVNVELGDGRILGIPFTEICKANLEVEF